MKHWSLRVAPWIPLLAVVALLGHDVVAARRWSDPEWIDQRVDRIDEIREERREPFVFSADSGDTPRVFVFGSSSVAVPSLDAFNTPFLGAMAKYEQPVVVDNFGVEGLTSWNVLLRVEEVLSQADSEGITPAAAVLYYGHNDVTYTFHAALGTPGGDPQGFPSTRLTALPGWGLAKAGYRAPSDGETFRIFRHQRTPPLVRLFQRLGLVDMSPRTTEVLTQRVLTHYEENTGQILAAFHRRSIPVLLVTPLGYLEMEPYGPLSTAGQLWSDARLAPTPQQRNRLLVQARDAELFTSDLRAKTPMLEVLRRQSARGDGVYLCDLEAQWVAAGVAFDRSIFVDPLHYSDEGYRRLTTDIAKCLVDEILVAEPKIEEIAER